MAQDSSSGSSVIVAGIILGLSILAGSFMLKTSVDSGSARLGEVAAGMEKLTEKLAAAPAAAPAAPTRPGRPDPNKVYDVAIGDAPTHGPANAAIKIVEFSDFQ